MRSLSKTGLQEELQVSKPLAELNYQRYQNWNKLKPKPAFWLYSGDVYNGLDAFSIDNNSADFAQNHVAIISGLYGILRPFDSIKPYRLEMKLPVKGPWGENLYAAWANKISEYLASLKEDTVLMCASKEYAKAVTSRLPDDVTVVTPRFMQETDNGLKEKGLFAKYARGAMARWVIDNRLESLNGLQNYTQDGFLYSSELSSESEYVYIVPKDFSLKGRFTKQK